MIILKSIGGLGNQMFEIAYAKMLAKKKSQKILVDTSVYNSYKIREYSLNHLKISENYEIFSEKDIGFFSFIAMKFAQNSYRVLQKIIKIITKNDKMPEIIFQSLSKIGLNYNFDVYYYPTTKLTTKKNNIYGYFQSEKYFEDIKDEIIEDFQVITKPTFEEQALLDLIVGSKDSIAVSMRVGEDYENSKVFNVCTKSYYNKALKTLKKVYPDSTVFIFSDDIQKVKKEYDFGDNIVYVEGFNDYQNLRLLYNCDNFIISNSSFSWWGSYLSKNEKKIIIAPSRWYNISKSTPAIYTKEMTLIDP